MRKAAALLLTAVILLLSVIPADAFTIIYDGKIEDYPWAPIVLVVDGNTVETEEMPPVILNGRTMVPMRVIFEALGATVDWDGATQTAIGETKNATIKITIGKDFLFKNDNVVRLDSPAVVISGRTLVPVRAIAESLDRKVEWYGETRVVEILK